MKIIALDGKQMTTIQSCHEHLAAQLQLPSYYGKNLDALWDIVSTISEDTHITLSSSVTMLNALDTYGSRLIHLFFEADSENPHVRFELIE